MGFLDERPDGAKLDRLFGDLHRETHGFLNDRKGFGEDKRIRAEALTEARRLEKSDPGLAARKYRETSDALLGARGTGDRDKRARLSTETEIWRTVKHESVDAARTAHGNRPYAAAVRKLPISHTGAMRGDYEIASLPPEQRGEVALALTGRSVYERDVLPALQEFRRVERAVDAEQASILAEQRGPRLSRDQAQRLGESTRSTRPARAKLQEVVEGAVPADWSKPLAGRRLAGDDLLVRSDGSLTRDTGPNG